MHMLRKCTFFSLLISGLLFANQDAAFSGYTAIQKALANDQYAKARNEATHLIQVIEEWQKTALAVESPQGQAMALSLSGLKTLETSTGADLQRKSFSKVSEGFVRYIRLESTLQPKFQLFFCPMVTYYGYWVQPKGEQIANPYMGQAMPTCGSKRPW